MLNRSWLGHAAVLVIAGALSLPLSAQDAAPSVTAEFVDPDSPDVRSYRSAGEYAIDRLAMTMITDSAAAVSRGTEIQALSTFHLKDVPMKNGTVAGLPRISELKLTSLKLTNPANAPDAADVLALNNVKAALFGGDPPRILVQRIQMAGGPAIWRVYKPLANIRQCGSCHGSPDAMTPELRQALKTKYPDDQGNGFAVGEWRGLIRVTVESPAAPPKPAAPAGTPAKPATRN